MVSFEVRDGWERAFRLTFERSSNGMALVDRHREFVDINDSLLEILGARREQVVGSSVVESIPTQQLAFAQREWDAFLRSGTYSGGGPIVRADGQEVEIEVAARLLTLDGQRLALCVVTYASPPGLPLSFDPQPELTDREREVVTRIALGRATRQIADELFISTETVRSHVRNAMGKLGTHTRAQLVATVLSREGALHRDPLEIETAEVSSPPTP